MSGKEEYVDVTKQGDSSPSQPMRKEKEARIGDSSANDVEGPPPPTYSNCAAESSKHKSLNDVVEEDIHSLMIGDPDEIISVPMVHTHEKQTFKTVFLGKAAKISHTVVVRKMNRAHYLKFYAKDREGNYVGTEKAAVDAGLVFVPSKSTSEDLLQQVRKVAFGKPHYANDFGHVMGTTGPALGGVY